MVDDLRNDIPFPGTGRGLFTAKYGWADMEIGESFRCEPGKHETVANAARIYGNRHGKKFRVTFVRGTSPREYRCWRIE